MIYYEPMKKSKIWFCCAAIVVAIVPCCSVSKDPTLMWKSGNPRLQERSIPMLMAKLQLGMTEEEVWKVMGEPPPGPRPARSDGRVEYSFNVNSWYNRGLDLSFRDGRLVRVDEYD